MLLRWAGLDLLQEEFGKWLTPRMIGREESTQEDIIKCIEELGELAQAVKRSRTEGRISEDEGKVLIAGEVADIVFCMLSVCNHENLLLSECLTSKWINDLQQRSIPGGKNGTE